MNRMHGIIFAYEQRGELRELTERRTAASMPFGGRYRAVDFALSNLLNAGVTDVGMVLHGRYQSMLDHVGSGKVWDMSRKRGGLHLLPPFNYLHEWGVTPFRGKMEALAGVRDYLNEIRQDYVVLTDSDLPSADGYEWPVFGKQADLQLINMRGVDADDPQWDTFMDQLTFDQLAKICANGLRMTIAINEIGKPETVDHNGPSGVTQKYSVGSNGYAVQTNDPDKNMKGTCYPCNGIIAATMNSQLVEEVGELIGEDAMWAGYAGLYGTGLNIHRSPYSGRVFEYYSEDGILTGLIDARETVGIQSKGVYVYNKHFVLNDQENNRAGIGTWCNEQALREIYLRAFELPIIQADAQCVMTAFNRLGAIWAGAYTELLTDWLRGEAGMSGFAVTDMYDGTYMVKVNEIVAGNDLPDNFVGEDISELKDYGPDGAKANPMVAQALRTSAKRVLNTVVNSRGMDGISQYTRVVREATWWQLTLNIAQWALGALTAVAFVLVVLDGKKKGAKK